MTKQPASVYDFFKNDYSGDGFELTRLSSDSTGQTSYTPEKNLAKMQDHSAIVGLKWPANALAPHYEPKAPKMLEGNNQVLPAANNPDISEQYFVCCCQVQ